MTPSAFPQQTKDEVQAIVATLKAGQHVRIVEDAPGWPLRWVEGTVVGTLSGTLTLDTLPWPIRLPSGQAGPVVHAIEVLP